MSTVPWGLVQTFGLVTAPFLLPRIYTASKSILFPSPGGTRTPLGPTPPPPPPETSLNRFRRLICALSLCICIYYAFLSPSDNPFLFLAPSTTLLDRFVPILRTPLDLRIPLERLATKWIAHSGREVLEENEVLLSQFRNFDHRKAFVGHGKEALLYCSWKSKSAGISKRDLTLYNVPSMAQGYVWTGLAVGLLLESTRRRRWRAALLGFLFVVATGEVWYSLNWDSAFPVSMRHSTAEFVRPIIFAFTILTAYFLPPSRVPGPTSTSELVMPILQGVTLTSAALLERLRVANLQRMAILSHQPLREQATKWSEMMEQKSTYANQHEKIIEIRNQSGLAPIVEGQDPNHSKATVQTKNWIANFLVDQRFAPPLAQAEAEKLEIVKE